MSVSLAIGGAAAMGIPIAIHLLSRYRRQLHLFGAMRFVIAAYRRQKHRLRLEQWLLLLVRCLIPLLLGLALWDPQLSLSRTGLGALGVTDRTVCLVVDDALSSSTQQGQAQRLDTLKQQALAILDGLNRSDRVALWRASRPGGEPVLSFTFDHQAARQAIAQLASRASRSDWEATLASVADHLQDPAHNAPADRAWIVLLSDWSLGTLPQGDLNLARLGQTGQVLVSVPLAAASNTAVTRLESRRGVLFRQPGLPLSLSVELELRRFDADAPVTAVELSILDAQQNVVLTQQREHRWSTGQTSAVLTADLPLPPSPQASGVLTLRARLSPDALTLDDQRLALAQVRSEMRLALVDQSDSPLPPGVLDSPRAWLSSALWPWPGLRDDGAILLTPLPAADLDEASLRPHDAVMVLRPDLLAPQGWTALRSVLDRGGVVWVFTPPDTTSAAWSAALGRLPELDWELGLEPVAQEQPWSLRREEPPAPLRVLAADWADLLAPLRVTRRLPLRLPRPEGQAWLRVQDTHADRGDVLLAAAKVGRGSLLLFTAALDPAWTNLATKPLFVPLLHESLRTLLSSSQDAAQVSVVSGDRPLLVGAWEGVTEVALRTSALRERVMLRRTDAGLEPIAPLLEPGAYEAAPVSGLSLVVNADAHGSDTRGATLEQLAPWLNTAGAWRPLEAQNPASFLQRIAASTALGWPLLWAVAALLLLEAILARRFSHALVERRPSVARRFWRAVHGEGV